MSEQKPAHNSLESPPAIAFLGTMRRVRELPPFHSLLTCSYQESQWNVPFLIWKKRTFLRDAKCFVILPSEIKDPLTALPFINKWKIGCIFETKTT